MKQEWIIIVGAGPNQVPLIRIAQDRGLSVFATDMDPHAPGFAVADAHAIASTKDPDATARVSIEFAERTHVVGVMTIAADVSETVAEVAARLGLPGIPAKVARSSTHKARRIARLTDAGVPSPRYIQASDAPDAIQRIAAGRLSYPLVFKPVDGAGARGVQKLNAEGDLVAAVDSLSRYSQRPEFLIEEFLQGTEHSIEGVVFEGTIHWTGLSDRNYDKKEKYAPFFLEDGDTLPTALSEDTVQQVQQAANAAVKALGITWGPVKGDILVNSEGPKVIEMASRLSGDYFCWETVPLHNGTRLVDFVLDIACGKKPDPTFLEPDRDEGVALRYYFPPHAGKVRAIHGIDDAKESEGVYFFRWEPKWTNLKVGDDMTLPAMHGDRVCCVLARGTTREQAVRNAEAAIAKIRIDVEAADETTHGDRLARSAV